MKSLLSASILLVALTWQGVAPTSAALEHFEIENTFDFDRAAGDNVTIEHADITPDGKALVYLSNGLHRLNLDTGRDEALIDRKSLDRAGLEMGGGGLRATADAKRLVYVSESWKCNGTAFLIALEPLAVTRLTDGGWGVCGEADVSPGGARVAVVTSKTCADRQCGLERLLIFDIQTGKQLFKSACDGLVVDLWWEGEDDCNVRQRFYPKDDPNRSEDKVFRVVATGDHWGWGEPELAGAMRVRDFEVESPRLSEKEHSVCIRAAPSQARVSIRPSDLFGPVPPAYVAEVPRVFRAKDRIVIVRTLVKLKTTGGTLARREQIAVLKLKTSN